MAKRIPLKKARELYQKEKALRLSPKPNPSRKNKHIGMKRHINNFITKLKLSWYQGGRDDLVKKLEKDEDGSQ